MRQERKKCFLAFLFFLFIFLFYRISILYQKKIYTFYLNKKKQRKKVLDK